MNAALPANGQRAALAMAAVRLYARSSPGEIPAEASFFDFQRDALPGGDQDRLSALLCGLLHYAERRGLSFTDAVTAARQEHARQRTAYQPGSAVRPARARKRARADGTPLAGEVISARPGRPPSYLVEFVTGTRWLPETELEPAAPFPSVTASCGTFASAYVARVTLERAIRAIEASYRDCTAPDGSLVTDLNAILPALSAWSGTSPAALLRTFGEIITEKDGLLIACGHGSRPVTLAAAGTPPPPAAPGEPGAAGGPDADILPFRRPARRPPAGPRQ